jgi:hypothetical protein
MNESPSTTPTQPRSRIPVLISLGIVATFIFIYFLFRAKNEPVTRQRLSEARAQWEKRAPKNYDLEVIVSGRQGATYEIRVRNGQVVAALRNRAPLLQHRTFATWSGSGMLDTIETDMETLEFALKHPDDPKRMMLTLRARFDKDTGLPLEYLRSQWGAHHDVTWTVTRFEPK